MKHFFQARPHLIPSLIAIVFLIVAVTDRHPYGFYQLLRWIVCGSAAFIAYIGWATERQWALWLFVGIAILFNPLEPIHLNRDAWQMIDMLTTIPLFLSIFLVKKKDHVQEQQAKPDGIEMGSPEWDEKVKAAKQRLRNYFSSQDSEIFEDNQDREGQSQTEPRDEHEFIQSEIGKRFLSLFSTQEEQKQALIVLRKKNIIK
jgi:hypothetical protein